MARGAGLPQSRDRREGILRRALRAMVLGITLLFVVSALTVSCALVVYTAWDHDLSHGIFALLFAVLSAQIALNWFLWKDERSEPPEACSLNLTEKSCKTCLNLWSRYPGQPVGPCLIVAGIGYRRGEQATGGALFGASPKPGSRGRKVGG